MPPEYFVAIAIVSIVAITITKVVKALVAARQSHGDSASALEQLATALEDTQRIQSDQAAQIAELQERVDFAERLLAQTRERAALEAQHKRE
ncbi:MAG TPA: hypothetical protein VFP39_07895 [Gemmatimonadales bacterium]|nr:hypothetical protein [Gemmatimonadales bacterium]